MKKYNFPTDETLREVLNDHRMAPSDATRNAILKDAMQLPPAGKRGETGMILLSVFIALAVMGIISWFALYDKQAAPSGKQPVSPSKGAPAVIPQTGVTPVTPHSTGQKAGAEDIKAKQQTGNANFKQGAGSTPENFRTRPIPEEYQPFPGHTGPDSSRSTTLPAPEVIAGDKAISLSPDTDAMVNHVSQPPDIRDDTTRKNPPGPDTISAPVLEKTAPAEQPYGVNRDVSPKERRSSSTIVPSVGVYYTPEWMFNTLEGTKSVSNFGVEGTFHFGRFSIRTGAGLSVNKGTNELSVAYNDFLGSYNKLDSMKFKWNTPTQNYIATMYMSRKDVWDSLMKLEYPKVVKRYTYLQVPMIMGYDLWQSDAISIGLRAGPVMSVLLTSRQLSAAFDPGQKRIISINDISPGQVSLNWQAMAGISVSIRLVKDWVLEVEPSYRYYFNSVYEKPEAAMKPWSVGIRVALMLEL